MRFVDIGPDIPNELISAQEREAKRSLSAEQVYPVL
jgi:hypothetical protein